MRYFALASDYDGTLAADGRVDAATRAALERLLKTGRKLVLVTGRRLEELLEVFPQADLFDSIVAENGALLYTPREHKEELLTEPPSDKFVQALRDRGVGPIAVGKAIVATWEPHEVAVLETIRDLGLELQVTFNKGAVMVLPSGVNKRTGLAAALRRLGLSVHNTVGVGDAENDHAFLSVCEYSAAVANALDSVKERVDLVTVGDHGAGVVELIDLLLADDLTQAGQHVSRNNLLLGSDAGGGEIRLPPFGTHLLIAGPSGSGKSTAVTAILERLVECAYQFFLIDPEGDYAETGFGVTVGDPKTPPIPDAVVQLLDRFENPVVNLLGISMTDRPAFCIQLLHRVSELAARAGRPHWLVLDEAHHMMPTSWHADPHVLLSKWGSSIMVTVHPASVSPAALAGVNAVIAVGAAPGETLADFCQAVGDNPPQIARGRDDGSEVIAWFRGSPEAHPVHVAPSSAERRRHRRKYAEGDIQERSFYFRGPAGSLNLRAQNLNMFIQIAEGVDDDTWVHHLRRGDYSDWMRTAIKDERLAEQVSEVEQAGLSPAESRARIKAAIENEYTGAA